MNEYDSPAGKIDLYINAILILEGMIVRSLDRPDMLRAYIAAWQAAHLDLTLNVPPHLVQAFALNNIQAEHHRRSYRIISALHGDEVGQAQGLAGIADSLSSTVARYEPLPIAAQRVIRWTNECSHCDRPNPVTERTCYNCAHDSHVPKNECACAVCSLKRN